MSLFTYKSVLLHESIESLSIIPSGIYIDGTFGLGGHSKLILSKLNKHGRLISIDRDYSSVIIGKSIGQQDQRFKMIHAPFSQMFKYIDDMKLVGSINGILLDLGMSVLQLFDPNRGFSFMKDGPLDMRMDISSGQSAAKWLYTESQKNIVHVLKKFGEEKFSTRIAKAIVLQRKIRPILRSVELSKLICRVIPYRDKHKHPATRSFLAIRMYINKELQEITKMLQDVLTILSSKGRLVVISFNSLEDRLVKNFIYQHSRIIPVLPKLALTDSQIFNIFYTSCQLIDMGKIVPSIQEIKTNIRSRSAILRYAEKK